MKFIKKNQKTISIYKLPSNPNIEIELKPERRNNFQEVYNIFYLKILLFLF